MATIKPFAALRPDPKWAAQICELPYDVLSSAEARAAGGNNPLSFFHVSKPEIDLPPDINPYDPRVYEQGRESFAKLRASGALRQDAKPCFYLYRQIMKEHGQVGLVAVASCDDYLRNVIKKHELTRVDKEDDRVRHIEVLNAQTGPAFLTYLADPTLDACFARNTAEPAEVDFVAPDGVRHSAWTIREQTDQALIESRFAQIPALYIADGHHRTAAAARVAQARHGAGSSGYFLSVIFPHNQVQILPYHRVLKDLNGMTPGELLQKLDAIFVIQKAATRPTPRPHQVGLYVAGQWHQLAFRPHFANTQDPVERLDVTLLQKYVLSPLFKIEDPRTSQRINFVGGIRGPEELERVVNSGEYACAFALFPTRLEELIAIADAGGIMPPKSTWFEPKLRDGMFSHLLS